METIAQILLNQRATDRTHLRRVARVDQDDTTSGSCCLLHRDHLVPRSVADGLRQGVVLEHPFVFKSSKAMMPNVFTSERLSLCAKSRRRLAMRSWIWATASRLLRQSGVSFSTVLSLRWARAKARSSFRKNRVVGDCCPIRKRRERLQSNVDADRLLGWWHRLHFSLDSETGEPFAGCGATNGQRLDGASDWPVQSNLDTANLGELQTIPFQSKAKLRISEAVVAALATKTRIARLFPSFDAPEERLEC